MFKKIFVANRGEIAVRVIRACHDLGVTAVAVYSDIDKHARHVQLADEAFNIGQAAASQSYLKSESLIETALKTGARAIHPGYGFLAESPEFAAMVTAAGLAFIGPDSKTIAMMGDKMAARRTMQKAGVPVVPGTAEPLSNKTMASEIANRIGYPVMVKAAGGGGGKGLRVVNSPQEFPDALRAASHEAHAAFGDDRIYIEKYLDNPRHIEIQVLADKYGNYIHLGERDCSIQRRHQKIIEEAPGPIVDPELRAKMGNMAIAAARACNYINAGTIEFLMINPDEFYFLEMNTRIQVEHPVTEMITGIDLIIEQIKIAAGEHLSLKQSDIQFNGHAIECRINAEDPFNYLPSVGIISRYQEPQGPGVRIDSGVTPGTEITIHYDSLIAKLIAYGKDRNQAIARMKRALNEIVISGILCNVELHRQIMSHSYFQAGNYSTGFLESIYFERESIPEKSLIAAGLAAALIVDNGIKSRRISESKVSNWAFEGRRQMLRS
jgi:acetyl-CoA carboxylase biotin carboxylase subunit